MGTGDNSKIWHHMLCFRLTGQTPQEQWSRLQLCTEGQFIISWAIVPRAPPPKLNLAALNIKETLEDPSPPWLPSAAPSDGRQELPAGAAALFTADSGSQLNPELPRSLAMSESSSVQQPEAILERRRTPIRSTVSYQGHHQTLCAEFYYCICISFSRVLPLEFHLLFCQAEQSSNINHDKFKSYIPINQSAPATEWLRATANMWMCVCVFNQIRYFSSSITVFTV